MKINGIEYKKLSIVMDYADPELPSESGVYYWVYWPHIDASLITPLDFEKKILQFCKNQLTYSEKFNGHYKFTGEISEQWFKNNGNLFGLSDRKNSQLKTFLSDRDNRIGFSKIIQELCFGRPFYIGKANNLRRRLTSHFRRHGNSTIMEYIDSKDISYSEIWVGVKLVNTSISENMNTIVEEIFSRVFKPGLTRKPN